MKYFCVLRMRYEKESYFCVLRNTIKHYKKVWK